MTTTSSPQHTRGVSAQSELIREMREKIAELTALVDTFEAVSGTTPPTAPTTPPAAPRRAPAAPTPAARRRAENIAARAADGPRKFSALESLKFSIGNVGQRYVPEPQRDEPIWRMVHGISEARLTGEPRWTLSEPDVTNFYASKSVTSQILTLDRRASYFSACGNVRVAMDVPYATGPLELERALRGGGFFRIKPFTWDVTNLPHPLGQIVDRPDGEWWVTAPHLQLLTSLSRHNLVPTPVVIDSYAAAANDGAFKLFAAEVQQQRALSGNAVEGKRQQSAALRMLWSAKSTSSPFWRPDWSIAIRAEAAVRHWAKAWRTTEKLRALELGDQTPTLVGLTTVDEAQWWMPEGTGPAVVPEGYTVGDSFGHVSIKSRVTLEQHLAARKDGRRG